MYTIEQLKLEHENIIRLNRVIRMSCLRILDGKNVDSKEFYLFIEFIRTYADQLHHGKEELFLFKEMQETLGSAAQTLVRNGMLVEHDLGRLYVKQLESAVMAYEKDSSNENKLDIISNAMSYIDLLKRHIERENGAVFPFAERGLSANVQCALDKQTREFEVKNHSICEHQLTILKTLERHYNNS